MPGMIHKAQDLLGMRFDGNEENCCIYASCRSDGFTVLSEGDLALGKPYTELTNQAHPPDHEDDRILRHKPSSIRTAEFSYLPVRVIYPGEL